jgi:hypothetical protein
MWSSCAVQVDVPVTCLLRSGIDVRRLSAYLGRHNASITLGFYAHLIPDDEARSLREIEAALADPDGPAPAQRGSGRQ